MFSKSNSLNKEPEGLFFGRHSNNETNNLKVNKNRKTSDTDIDLINLEDDRSMTRKPYDNKIHDLQIKELEKFLSTVEISSLQNGQPITKEQEAQYQLFFDKYEHEQKAKNTNKIKLKTEVINFPGTSNNFIITPRVLTPKLYNMETHQDPVEDLIDEVLLEKTLENQNLRYSNIRNFNEVTHNVSNVSPKSLKNKSEAENDIMTKIISNNEINYMTSSRLADKNVNLQNDLSKTNVEHYTKHINAKINEQVSKLNIKYLEAITFDEKLFTKRNNLKSNSEKLHLTKGPTLYEKSVALPQIMKRLVDTKKMLEGNTERKLALDAGTSHFKLAKGESNLSPYLSNKPKSHELDKTVNYPNQVSLTAVKKTNEITSLGVTSKTSKPLQAAVPGSTNKSIAAEDRVINGGSRFISIDELKALRREKLRNEDKDNYNHVLMPPQILMSDCNKNRFVAHATGTLLHDFVYGKY